MTAHAGETVQALLDPPRWGNKQHGGRDAHNLAACAMVAAKVYEAFGWVRWNGHDGRQVDAFDDEAFHVPDAEALLKVLHDLSCLALDRPEEDHGKQVGVLRFIAYADDDGADSSVNIFLDIGSVDASEIRSIRDRAAALAGSSDRGATP